MNSKLKMFATFLGGLLLGSLITFLVIGKITQNQFADSYIRDVFEQVMLAKKLRENKQKEISDTVESRLPSYVLAIHQNKELKDSEYSNEALWHIKSFYEINSIPIPNEISEILNNLPEHPNSCRINNLAN